MLRRDDPAFKDLVAEIKALVSSRYVEDPESLGSPFYKIASGDEPRFAFASLNRRDRLELLADMVPWRDYGREGITADQQRVMIANVLDGKPPERWLEGAFDRDVQQNAIQSILRDDPPEPSAFDRDVQQKAFRDLLRDDAPEPSMGRKEGRDLDGFDRAVANLRRHFHDHSLGENWQDVSAERKVGYLASFAAVHDAPFERFANAARHVLGCRSQEDLTPDDWWHLRRQYREAMRSRAFGKEVSENAADLRGIKSQDRGRDIGF